MDFPQNTAPICRLPFDGTGPWHPGTTQIPEPGTLRVTPFDYHATRKSWGVSPA
jgi:hypothetical protein